jgi:hypothetical protein
MFYENSIFNSREEDNKIGPLHGFFCIIKLMPSLTFCFIHSVFVYPRAVRLMVSDAEKSAYADLLRKKNAD